MREGKEGHTSIPA